jgi:hypothetical protein
VEERQKLMAGGAGHFNGLFFLLFRLLMNWIHLDQDKAQGRALINTVMVLNIG